MSAVLTRRRPPSARDLEAGRQESLFGAWVQDAPHEAAAGPAAVAVEPAAAPVRVRTLDEAISSLWGELRSSGAVASCPACGAEALRPRHSAAAGVVGGRCDDCGTTLA